MARSGIAWLSSSSAEIARARAVLKALTPGGTLDELGFLLLNGAFADFFYPGVTTPMTRARYFILVPAIYQYLEQSGKGIGRDVDRLSRDLQFELLKLVRAEDGAIGRESGRNIVRPPSEIYWNALGSLRLATRRVSLASYQQAISKGEFRREVRRDDDDAAHADDQLCMWDQSMRLGQVLPSDGTFPSATTLRLRKWEAALLESRYSSLKSKHCIPLIPYLVSVARERGLSTLEDVVYPWDAKDFVPTELAEVLEQARLLSLFARGTTLQYYRMLIEKKGLDDPGSHAFSAWWEVARDDLAGWNPEKLFALAHQWDADRRPREDRVFIKGWIGRCVAGSSADSVLHDAEARSIIAAREDAVRRGKQRLKVKFQLDSWQPLTAYPTDEFYQLTYRHRVGLQFAEDIVDGLERGSA